MTSDPPGPAPCCRELGILFFEAEAPRGGRDLILFFFAQCSIHVPWIAKNGFSIVSSGAEPLVILCKDLVIMSRAAGFEISPKFLQDFGRNGTTGMPVSGFWGVGFGVPPNLQRRYPGSTQDTISEGYLFLGHEEMVVDMV